MTKMFSSIIIGIIKIVIKINKKSRPIGKNSKDWYLIMKIDSSVELKKAHVKEIIQYLRRNERSAKKKISEDLNLSFATVSNICNEMREKGYLEEVSLDEMKVVGRTPKGISLKEENLLSLCLDLTKPGKIKAAVVNYREEFLYKGSAIYEEDAKIEEFLKVFGNFYKKEILSRFRLEQIIGVGVAVPGIFEKSSHNIVSSEIEFFNNQPLKTMLARILKKDVYVDNDSNLCVMAKYQQEAAVGSVSDVVYLFADEGLGIGVVANGQQLCGSDGYAPEICHMPIGNQDLICHLCGNRGCVESDLGMQGYVKKYNIFGSKKLKKFDEFVTCLEKRDEIAERVMDENARICGKLLSILNNIFNPNCIYIGGETAYLLKEKQQQIYDEISSRLLTQSNVIPKILVDSDCEDTMLIGAAERVYFQWIPEI